MVPGLKTRRTHHYVSDLETSYHLLAEFDPEVKEIREQYALLPWEETQEIAGILNIRHPRYPDTQTPIVMTSDLVLTVERPDFSGLEVWSVKPHSEIDPEISKAKRTLEKLLIEKAYWTLRNAHWELKTDLMLPKERVKNLNFLLNGMLAIEPNCPKDKLYSFVKAFKKSWGKDTPLNGLLIQISEYLNLETTQVFNLLGRAVWTQKLSIDLDKPLHYQLPVPLKRCTEEKI
jgi:hypothetical protein